MLNTQLHKSLLGLPGARTSLSLNGSTWDTGRSVTKSKFSYVAGLSLVFAQNTESFSDACEGTHCVVCFRSNRMCPGTDLIFHSALALKLVQLAQCEPGGRVLGKCTVKGSVVIY